jgi:hypothetical protein
MVGFLNEAARELGTEMGGHMQSAADTLAAALKEGLEAAASTHANTLASALKEGLETAASTHAITLGKAQTEGLNTLAAALFVSAIAGAVIIAWGSSARGVFSQ